VLEHLYEFLEVGKNPITEDGCFLAYKAVRGDFLDIYSGKFDNSIGAELKMLRNKVDENQNNTCSSGFHVCSFDYLRHFASAGGHVMVCKVNPADVVAIPADYHNTKMRVCRYEVVGEHLGYYAAADDTLASSSVTNDGSLSTFSVQRSDYEGGQFDDVSQHARLMAAAQAMEALLEESNVFAVQIVNMATGAVVAEEINDDYLSSDEDDHEFEDEQQRFGFHLFERLFNEENELGSGFNTLAQAVTFALDCDENSTYLIRDDEGTLVKTIS
jgi:hypothetical protein